VPIKTLTPTPTPAPRYPGIVLREPPDNQKRETVALTFQWEPIDLNRDGDHYQVCVRRPTSQTWEKTFDAGRDRQLIWGREQNAGFGYGDLIWTVFVIDVQGNIASDKDSERKLYWCHPRSGCQECSSCHR
jgi:hypothetical protein